MKETIALNKPSATQKFVIDQKTYQTRLSKTIAFSQHLTTFLHSYTVFLQIKTIRVLSIDH